MMKKCLLVYPNGYSNHVTPCVFDKLYYITISPEMFKFPVSFNLLIVP